MEKIFKNKTRKYLQRIIHHLRSWNNATVTTHLKDNKMEWETQAAVVEDHPGSTSLCPLTL